MSEITGRTYGSGDSVDIDGMVFTDCRFEGTQLRYSGGPLPRFNNCGLGTSGFYFADAALRTIQLLQDINNAPGGSAFITDLFQPNKYLTE